MMTPREPDRSYDAGHDLWKRLQGQGTSNQIGILIAALRAEAAEARAAALDEAHSIAYEAGAEDVADQIEQLRALKPDPAAAPAAGLVVCEHCPDHPHPLNDDATKCRFPRPAPAAETGKDPWEVDCSWPAKEPAPAQGAEAVWIEAADLADMKAWDLAQSYRDGRDGAARIGAALNAALDLRNTFLSPVLRDKRRLAYRVLASEEITTARVRCAAAEKRIAELEAALREASGLIEEASWPCNEALMLRVRTFLAARATPQTGEGR